MTIREALTEDGEGLFQLFFSTAGAHLVDVPDPMRSSLLQMQWRSREATYGAVEGSQTWVVLENDNLVASYCVAGDRLLDIRVSPEHQGKGIGKKILQGLQSIHERLELQVAIGNPALHLYLSLGFTEVSRDSTDIRMVWPPSH